MWLSSPDAPGTTSCLPNRRGRPERVDHLVIGVVAADQPAGRFEREVDRRVRGDHEDVRGRDRTVVAVVDLQVLVEVLVAPPPLEALHLDLHRVRRDLGEPPDQRHGGHDDDGQQHRGRDRPPDLQARVAVQLLGHALAALAMAKLDGQPEDAAFDEEEHHAGDRQREDEHVLLGLGGGTGGVEGVLRDVLAAGAHQHGEHEEPTDHQDLLAHVTPHRSDTAPGGASRQECTTGRGRAGQPGPLSRHVAYVCRPAIHRFTA